MSTTLNDHPTKLGTLQLNNVQPKTITTNSRSLTSRGVTDEGVFNATTTILGQANVAVQGVSLRSGDVNGEIDLGSKEITLDQILQPFKLGNLPLDQLVFTNVKVQLGDTTLQTSGLSSSVSFTGDLKMNTTLLKVFKDFIGIGDTLTMSGQIVTKSEDLSKPINPESITLSSIASFQKDLFLGTTLKDLSFTLDFTKESDKWNVSPKLEGQLDIVHITDNSENGLAVSITEEEGSLKADASAKNIKGAFGFEKLVIDEVSAAGSVGNDTTELNLNASLEVGPTTFGFKGVVNKDAVGLSVPVDHFSFTEITGIFNEITGEQLSLPNFDVAFKDTTVSLASNDLEIGDNSISKGFTFASSLTVHGYTTKALAHIDTQGVKFEGTFGEIKLGPVTVNSTELDFQVYKKSSNIPTLFKIGGQSTIEGLTVECGIYFEKINGDFNTVLYGYLDAKSFTLSSIFKDLSGSFADSLSFSKAGFIFSTADTLTQDAELSFNVKKGLNLMGILEEIPALTELTKQKQIGLVLSAQISSRPSISIEVPNTRLQLGSSVKTDPFRMSIVTAPSPALQLVFGMDVSMPNQSNPLNFDAMLSVGAIEAKGAVTMQNYWNNPFGINGLKIGPTLGLQLGINYAQFAATGTPSEFGIAGGLVMGDVVVDMAVNVSSNPMNNVLYGKLQELSIQNVVSAAENMTGLDIPADNIPDFFELNDLQIYVAPAGGSIGVITYEPGFSFACDLVLLGKKISMYTRINDDGIQGKGHIDKIDFGPLKIQGMDGGDARMDLELTSSKQSILVDGEFLFLGTGQGIYVDASNKGIAFKFTRTFIDALTFEVSGESSGSIKAPETLDFNMMGVMDNRITALLKNEVAGKIHDVINATNEGIDKAQKKVDQAKKAYEAEFNKANDKLTKAQNNADAYLKKLQKDLSNAKASATRDINNAQNKLASAKATYNKAFNDAKNAVTKAEKDYNAGITKAQNELNVAKKKYDDGVNAAQRKVDAAKRDFDNSVGDAQRKVNDASRKVDGLLSQIRSKERQASRLKWYDPRKAKLKIEIAALYTAYGTAKAALATANAFLQGVKTGAKYAAFESAKAALQAAKYGVNYTAFKAAEGALQAAKFGAKYTAFESAKATLSAVQTGSEYTAWKAAEGTLEATKLASQKAIDLANKAINEVGSSAAYIALEAAKKGLEVVKTGSSAVAFSSAKAALETARIGATGVLKLAETIAKHSGDLVDVRSMKISGGFKKILSGHLFLAEVNIAILGKVYNLTFDFDVNKVLDFIESLFEKALAEAKQIAGV